MRAVVLGLLLALGAPSFVSAAEEVDLVKTMGWMQALLLKIKTDVNQRTLTKTTQERVAALLQYAKDCRQAEPPQGEPKMYKDMIDQLVMECETLSRAIAQKEFDAAKKSIARLEKLRTVGHQHFRPTKS